MINLKDIFKLKRELFVENTTRLSDDSVDSQIDGILLNYQDRASQEDELGESLMPEHFKIILEAGEEDEKIVGDDAIKADQPAKPRDQKINIDEFAQQVANLVEHYESLLDIKPVIITRAKNLLANGYLPEVVEEFENILDREFGIRIDDPEGMDREVPPAPTGGSAGPIEGGGV